MPWQLAAGPLLILTLNHETTLCTFGIAAFIEVNLVVTFMTSL